MEKLSFPEYNFKIKNDGQRTQIFDPFRKRYVALTPEEWVRQHILEFLVSEKGFPRGLMSVEESLKLHGQSKRADIVVYNNTGRPQMLVECKAPEVKLKQETFDQVARYNIVYQVPFLLISNGLEHYCCRLNLEEKTYFFLEEIPDFADISEA